MKKLLSVLSSFSLITFSTLSVVSCAGDFDYDSVYTEEPEGNNGQFVDDSTLKIVTKAEKLVNNHASIGANLGEAAHGKEWSDLSSDVKGSIQDQVYNYISDQLDLDASRFQLEIARDSTFSIPKLKGLTNESITEEAIVDSGNVKFYLKYLNKEIYRGEIKWSIPEFDVISSIANILNSNSAKNSIYDIKKIDIPLGAVDFSGVSMELTLGTITNLIGLLNTLLDSSLLGDVGVGIKNIMNMDVKGLAKADPDKNQSVYESFDKDFRKNLQTVFNGIKKLLDNFGIPSTITIPSFFEGKEPIEVSVDKLLEVNIFDIIDLDLSNLNEDIHQDVDSGMAIVGSVPVDIHVEGSMTSKGQKNSLKLIDLISNVAPNVVKLLNKFLNPDTYNPELGGSGNLLYLLLKELITDMDQDLETINRNNNDDNLSAGAAKSGLDSMFFNLILGYNKNKREEKDSAIYFKLKVQITAVPLGLTVKIDLLDDNLYQLLNKVRINPGEIVLKIINKLFNLEGEEYLDLNKPFISSEDNMQFIEPIDIYYDEIMSEADITEKPSIPFVDSDEVVRGILSGLDTSVTTQIADQINGMINGALPTLSLQDVINFKPSILLEQLGIVSENLENAEVKITQAHFVFQFWEPINKEWVSQTTGINDITFERYSSMKLHFFDVQFQIDMNTESNGSYTLKTRDDLRFDMIFDIADANKN
ncbi:hypothetical protein SCHIN_v1c02590 [Spiroplasma chinense]|uniref:Lipoprotein n=1 Tax=Spiroplasma chinense TaxID=216932 RepID=A0A5B9Y463_9MOLU|nr:lipoprotein [Spiroplasma chinense]QEH61456.1 hypothetical protein SCHIN_v1c02590 [Spiroplasma chinense]